MLKRLVFQAVDRLKWNELVKLNVMDTWMSNFSANTTPSSVNSLEDAVLNAIRRCKLTYNTIVTGDAFQLAKRCQLPIEIIKEIQKCHEARAKVDTLGLRRKRKRDAQNSIVTDIEGLDYILAGGLNCGEITEIFGISGSCKTLISMVVACNALKNQHASQVIWMDSGNCGLRVDMARRMLNQDETLMGRFFYYRSHYLADIIFALSCQRHELESHESEDTVLIILDCLTMAIWSSYADSGTTASHGLVKELSNQMQQLSLLSNVSILSTNLAVKDGGEEKGSFRRALGKVWDCSDNIIEMKSWNWNESTGTINATCKLIRSKRSSNVGKSSQLSLNFL